jgi:hypothetical protein
MSGATHEVLFFLPVSYLYASGHEVYGLDRGLYAGRGRVPGQEDVGARLATCRHDPYPSRRPAWQLRRTPP